MYFKSLFVLLLLVPQIVFAQPQTDDVKPDLIVDPPKSSSAQEQFLEGVKEFSNKDYEKAEQHFMTSHTLAPQNAYTLYNLGLSSYYLQHWGLTIGAWRKALYLEPSLKKSLFLLKEVESKVSQQNVASTSLWQQFLNQFIGYVQWGLLLSGFLLFFTLFFFLWIKYLGKRKTHQQQNLPPPPLAWSMSLSGLAFLLFVFLFASKIIFYFTPQAVALVKIEVKTSPRLEASTLFEVSEGQNLLIKRHQDQWSLVETQSGSLGWAPKEQLFQTSGVISW